VDEGRHVPEFAKEVSGQKRSPPTSVIASILQILNPSDSHIDVSLAETIMLWEYMSVISVLEFAYETRASHRDKAKEITGSGAILQHR
jgi:hypothetical protein